MGTRILEKVLAQYPNIFGDEVEIILETLKNTSERKQQLDS